MHHSVADFNARGPAIGEDAPRLALEHRQQRVGGLQIGIFHVQRDSQLSLQSVDNLHQLVPVPAPDEQRGGAEDLVTQRVIGKKTRRIGGEKRRFALVGSVGGFSMRGLRDVPVARKCLFAMLVSLEDALRQHGRGRNSRELRGNRTDKIVEMRPVFRD